MKRAMAIVVGFVTLVGGVRGEDLGRQVVIVYNEREPEGKVLAEYYAEQRGVPAENLCASKVRPSETISREEFDTVKLMAQKAREENEALKARLDELEAKLAK